MIKNCAFDFLKIFSLLCVVYRRGPILLHLWTEILCAILTLPLQSSGMLGGVY